MNASAGTGVFVLSLVSIPMTYLFNSLIYSNSVEAILCGAGSTIAITAVSARLVLKRKAPRDPLFYVFAAYAFLSVINLIIGLEQDGIIDGFMTFYLKEAAEPHINTAHGHMTSYWDGCVHYLMYLLMVVAITWGESYRAIGLYWAGSVLMRIIVYIPGNIVGKYGAHVSPLFLLHMLYVAVSIWACFRVCRQPDVRGALPEDIQESQRRTLWQRPVDLLFALYLLLAASFCLFRGLVALDCPSECCQAYTQYYEPYLKDPSAYPKIQMIVNMLYLVPYYVVTLYSLLVPGCEWSLDLTLVHAGAVAQAQFSHTGASLHTRTPFSYRVPADSQLLFLIVNVIFGLMPQLLSYHLLSNRAFFLRPPPYKTD
ncbi:transmembrane 6 superfamily member 1-like [Engraulis encrasicolus]|uniref:transmembrane 6 superfamily member 1-like n=1 Tax=Engraulis encrasicolus TaxID=184585 RepID=UPI002FD6D1CD